MIIVFPNGKSIWYDQIIIKLDIYCFVYKKVFKKKLRKSGKS